MRVVNFSEARNSLKNVIDQVIDDADYTVIARRDAPDAVVMSLDTFNSRAPNLPMPMIHKLQRSPSGLSGAPKRASSWLKASWQAMSNANSASHVTLKATSGIGAWASQSSTTKRSITSWRNCQSCPHVTRATYPARRHRAQHPSRPRVGP